MNVIGRKTKSKPKTAISEYRTRQCPDEIKRDIGHSKREQGKYNSAYSIGFVVYTCLVVVLAERKLTVLCLCCSHVVARLQVSLASRCLVADAHLWWLTLGERAMPDRSWAHFRTLVIARFGLVPDEGADTDTKYRDPEIYRDMYLERTMGHMVEYIMDAKVVAHAMQADAYVVELQVPVDDAEANDYDADDDMDAPEDQPEDPPIIDISSDDEDEDMEPEPVSGDWVKDADDLDDDPEEILYDDGDWDTDSDASSVITI
ncbi:hypothetical protein TIFTF001_039607 [Ficus carica]|uniref:Uncharacterized protein n=1 Tax=Ficus carica TaxID=3494 RepID=A0AA88JE91_FICCA|nr:hypothetical protein TIFTF001_039607 [Ficus carica]